MVPVLHSPDPDPVPMRGGAPSAPFPRGGAPGQLQFDLRSPRSASAASILTPSSTGAPADADVTTSSSTPPPPPQRHRHRLLLDAEGLLILHCGIMLL